MKNKTLLIMVCGGVCLLFAVFSGCGGRPGEKEYNKAVASWEGGDLVRAQSQLEKAIRKLSSSEKKSVANNQLGIIRWNLGKHGQEPVAGIPAASAGDAGLGAALEARR